MLNSDKSITMAKIARSQGISRARVTQIMNLLYLPQGLIRRILNTTAPQELKHFSEHRLRHLLSLKSVAEQVAGFSKLQMTVHPQPSACVTLYPKDATGAFPDAPILSIATCATCSTPVRTR